MHDIGRNSFPLPQPGTSLEETERVLYVQRAFLSTSTSKPI